jgi:acetolactate synthase I/II/III large subunit
MKVYEAIAEAVKQEGADILFGVLGNANMYLVAELTGRHGFKFIQAKHEQSATSMADGFARASGKIGVATATQGPGFTNTITSLVAARAHRTPLLMLAGHAPLSDPYNMQGLVDQHAMALQATQAAAVLNHPKSVDYVLGEAFRHLKAKEGPFVLNLPQDVQSSETLDPNWVYRPSYKLAEFQPPSTDDLEAAIRLIASAKAPALICGLGARSAHAEAEVQALAEFLGAPLAVTLPAKGMCSDYPLSVGVSGKLGTGLSAEVLTNADLIVAIGASLNPWTTQNRTVLRDKKLIQIDRRHTAFGFYTAVDVGLEGDAKVTVAALLERLRAVEKKPRQPNPAMVERIKTFGEARPSFEDGDFVDPRRAVWYLEDKLPKKDRIIVIDGGHAGLVAQQVLTSPNADSWGNGWDFGSIGQGLSIAIGASFARPGKRVTHVTADAAFMMNVADFYTAVAFNLPLTVIVLNDHAVGQEKHDLIRKHIDSALADTPQPELDRLAVGFGAKGFRVRRPEDLGEIDKAFAVTDGPVVVDIRINGDMELPISKEIAEQFAKGG